MRPERSEASHRLYLMVMVLIPIESHPLPTVISWSKGLVYDCIEIQFMILDSLATWERPSSAQDSRLSAHVGFVP